MPSEIDLAAGFLHGCGPEAALPHLADPGRLVEMPLGVHDVIGLRECSSSGDSKAHRALPKTVSKLPASNQKKARLNKQAAFQKVAAVHLMNRGYFGCRRG